MNRIGHPELEVAGHIAYNLPERFRGSTGERLHVQVFFNCLGDFMEVKKTGTTSSFRALDAPGAGWAYPKYFCKVVSNLHSAPETIIDMRTLEDLKRGCCPPILTGSMLGGEESED